jgi:hypothetical protein
MRFIDRAGKTPDAAWLTKAQLLTAQLRAAPDKAARDKIIDDNENVWRELRDWLLTLSHQKCWFSETKNYFTHGFDVEHFRPKKNVKNADGTVRDPNGYWWLAFDWLNYRICGNVGNIKKGTFFPLAPNSVRATAEFPVLVEDEQPLLLDPTVEEDPELLTFDEKGEAKPIETCKGWRKDRVTFSINRLKLNEHARLKEARKQLWIECRSDIDNCQKLMADYDQSRTVSNRQDVKAALKKIEARVRPEADLSATAIACLMASGLDWAQKVACRRLN